MIKLIYKKEDLRYVFFTTDNPKELKDLESYLNKIPQYQFMPSFTGVPKPEVFLDKFKSKDGRVIYWCHSGLWKCVYDWCEKNNIKIDGIDDHFKYTGFDLSLSDFQEYVAGWDLNLDPYDYQVKAAWLILKYRQSLSELATRAGKTLVAYIVFRYMMEHGAKKILMIVPSIHLVKQGVKDFAEYKEFFQTETVWAKGEFCKCANLTIGTYQSLVQRADKKSKKYDPKFFAGYDVVCVDEAHHLIAKSINTILGQDFMKYVKLRFGFTGTLPPQHTIESFACQALMGPKIQNVTTAELVDRGFLAKPVITQIRLKYEDNEDLLNKYIKCGEYLNSSYKEVDGKKVLLPKEERDLTIQHVKTLPFVLKQLKSEYTSQEYCDYLVDLCKAKGSNLLMLEQMIIHRSPERLQVMDDIIKFRDGNCIVFAHHTEYLKLLKNHFKEMFPDRPVYIITGTENLNKRMKIVDQMLTDHNAILCASYGCCSTGITFKNIDYGIFAQSFKSEIIVLQSIGRGLLKTETKDTFELFDIIDDLPTKRLLAQGISKIKTYKERDMEYRIVEK
jgi:superfamily II DNA or RNA helicase